MTRILNVALAPYELYGLAGAMVLLENQDVEAELLVPEVLADSLPAGIRNLFRKIHTPRIPNLSGHVARDLYGAVVFQRYIRDHIAPPDIVCFGAYRATATNYLAKLFKNTSRLVAFRQGIIEDPILFQRRNYFTELYYNAFNKLFGASTLKYRWGNESRYLSYQTYTSDPIHQLLSWTEEQLPTRFQREVCLPWPAAALKPLLQAESSMPGILVVGERLPLFEEGGDSQRQQYQELLNYIRERFSEYPLYFRPRKGLTTVEDLNLDGYILSPGNQPFELLLLQQPWQLVISVKSTASKQAAALGIPAVAAYRLFDLTPSTHKVLEDFYAGTPGVAQPRTLDDISLNVPAAAINLQADIYQQVILDV